MKNMRMILAALLVLATMLCLCACGETQPNPTTTAPTNAPTTAAPTTVPPTTENSLVEYKITVLYPDGTPAAGVKVQICLDDLCQVPVTTDENGVAIYRLPATEGYKAKLTKKLDGYVDADYIYFESGATEITIQLVAEDAA